MQKLFHLWHTRGDSSLVNTVNQEVISILILYNQSTVNQHHFLSLHQRRYRVVSRLWTRFSYCDCIRFRPRNVNKFPRKSSGSLLSSQRQNFLKNHLARVPITCNQQGTQEMKEEVLSSAAAQHMVTSGYEVSDLVILNVSGKILTWR